MGLVDPVETVIAWGIPGGTLLLVAVGTVELIRKKRGKRTGTPLAATYADEVTAMFYGTKRLELEHRDSMSMMREEDAQGAPPALDLERGVIRLRRD
ncbi:DUF6191 domain-containing protein [Amycolatopsis sp. NPDC006131]|uniref:DUF6191 domain-containing protein n=1 Tax=Amycolatopsis sp. NPDC006131 TaxID=3156731 RepID=UPI00339F09EE